MRRKDYESFFKDKKITVMGLGVLGRGLQVTQFLAECGAVLTITDLKNKKGLKTSLQALKKYKIKYCLGKHQLKDFANKDLIIKAAGVPLNSPYIKHALKKGTRVAMDASLFVKIVQKLKPQVTIIGITGTRGKSMTTALIYHILRSNKKTLGGNVYLGGNMREKATLPLLKNVRPGDFVVLELDSWQCQGFGDERLSPHIVVFTNLMQDHMNYYKNSLKKYLADKANIYRFQKEKDFFITNRDLLKILKNKPRGKVLLPTDTKVAKLDMKIFGAHNIRNASYAYEVARILGIQDQKIRRALKNFRGLEGRLQYLRRKKGIHIINDNNATTPEATVAGIKSLHDKYPRSLIILISGGADKGLELLELVRHIKKFCAKLVLLPGTGTERLKQKLSKNFKETKSLERAVEEAFKLARKNDVILFSPGFASFGLFNNEYERNDKFIRIIKRL